MSLNNIQLPTAVIHDLYKNNLILSDKIKVKKTQLPAVTTTLNILGNNKKHIIIVVADEEATYLTDEQLSFLMGILTACKLTMQDVALLNIKKNKDVTYLTIAQELKAQKIILFGVEPSAIALPLEFPIYQVQAYNNQVYLGGPLLAVLQNDKAEKAKLWMCLKNIFSIG